MWPTMPEDDSSDTKVEPIDIGNCEEFINKRCKGNTNDQDERIDDFFIVPKDDVPAKKPE